MPPGNPAVILHTVDGTNWSSEDPVATSSLYGVSAFDDSNAWAVGSSGTILHTTDGGATWAPQTSGTSQKLSGVAAVSPTEAWVVGGQGIILHTTNGGATWVPQTSNVVKELYRIAAASPRDLWAVGYQDTSVHTTDGGTTWTPYPGSIQYFNSVCALPTGDAWAVGWDPNRDDILRWAPGLHITSLSSSASSPGSTITITGTEFGTGPDIPATDYVRFASFVPAAGDYVSWNNNSIQIKVPAGAYGAADVHVHTTGDLTSNTLPFNVVPRIDTPLNPSNGQPGTSVVLSGSGFGPSQGDGSSHLYFNTTEAVTTAWSNNSITATVPALTPGTKAVKVNAYGKDSNTPGYMVNPLPVVTSLNPSVGNNDNSALNVSVDGNNFLSGATLALTGPSTIGPVTTSGSGTNLTAVLDLTGKPVGSYTAVVINPDTGSGSKDNAFTVEYPPPVITSMTPTNGLRGQTINGTSTGSNVRGGGGGSNLLVELRKTGCTSIPITITGPWMFQFTVPADAAYGAWDLYLKHVDDGKSDTLVGAFTVEAVPVTRPPAITSLSPDRGPIGTTVTLKGTNFGTRMTSGRGVAYALSGSYVMFNQTQCVEYLSWSDTQIVCKVPQGAVPGPVTVTTSRGTSNANHTFTPTVPLTPLYYLAEGSTAHGFSTFINIENPTSEDLNCAVNFLLTDGKIHTEMVGLPKNSQTTLNPEDFIGAQDFSTRVDCVQGKMIAVDRTMVWRGEGAPSPEAHSSIGTTSPQKTWYLAEGSSQWRFETWTLVENPNDKPTRVTLSYMIEGGPVRELEKTIPANSRASYSMKDDIGAADASVLVTSDLPVVTERSMYRDNRREGSCSIGTPSPGSNFYLAEGTSAWGFTTYVLIQNPNPNPTEVTLTCMTPSGPFVQKPFTMASSSRKTVRVNDAIKDTDFSIQVQSDRPVVAERAMYWGADTPLGEACHTSSGVCSAHETFYLPDGSTQEGVETFTLVENPNDAPSSRKTYSMADRLPDGRASIKVTSKTKGAGIVVERSMYWNNRGAGTDTIGAYVDSP
jgi:hypothetical protein